MHTHLGTLTLAIFLVICISQVMGKPRPVRDTTNSTEEPQEHTANANSTDESQGHTANTEEPRGHTTSTKEPQRHTDSTEELQGHTVISGEPLGQTISTEAALGHTNSTEELQSHTDRTNGPQGHTYSTEKPQGHTSSTEEPQGHTSNTEEPLGRTSSTEEPQDDGNITDERQGHTESTERHENTPCGDILTETIFTDKLYPSTSTFLMYPFAQPPPEYFQTPSPPICPIGKDVSDEVQINKVGTCPYDFVDNVNPKRIPAVMKEARCLCEHGFIGLYDRTMERKDTICREIMQPMKVLIQEGCVNGYYSYSMEEIQVAVGCLQVIG